MKLSLYFMMSFVVALTSSGGLMSNVGARNATLFASTGSVGRFIVNGNPYVGDLFTLYCNGLPDGSNIYDIDGKIKSLPRFFGTGMNFGELHFADLQYINSRCLYPDGGKGSCQKIITDATTITFCNIYGTCEEFVCTKVINMNIPMVFNDCYIKKLSLLSVESITTYIMYSSPRIFETLDCPSLKILKAGSAFLRGQNYLRNFNTGVLEQIDGYSLAALGQSRTVDEEGVKTILTVGNTIESFKSLSGSTFPYNMATNTKVVCSNGYIKYEDGAWVDHPNQ